MKITGLDSWATAEANMKKMVAIIVKMLKKIV
jgi:hypothetical protein